MRQNGFSLIEFMVAITIFSFVIGAVFQAHLTMTRANITETAKIEGQFESIIELQILENDIKNAGFCVPNICTVVSKDSLTSQEAQDWEGFSGSEVGDIFSNIVGTDRLYLSDLGEIVEDFSTDGTESGVLNDTDYTSMSNAKLNNGGYFATLSSAFAAGSTWITINAGGKDIDGGDNGSSNDYDFNADKALIIADTSGNPLEGRRINNSHSSNSTTINFMANEGLENGFNTGSFVIPAICYHLQKPGASSPFSGQLQVFTLARNSDPFLEGVEDFQVSYHYDSNSDGIWADPGEWAGFLPTAGYDSSLLRAIRVSLVVRVPKRQSNEVDARDSITVENNTLGITTEMKHYYRKEFTIEAVSRNIRE